MPKDKLKPCPFCGGRAERHTIGDDEPNNAGGDVICCTKCGASSHVEFGRKENLVAAWNTRPQQAPDDLREACDWPADGVFRFHDEPGEHDPCFVVMPDGSALSCNHHNRNGVDQARAQFIVDACNAALAVTDARLQEAVEIVKTLACECTGRCQDRETLPADNAVCAYRRARAFIEREANNGQ